MRLKQVVVCIIQNIAHTQCHISLPSVGNVDIVSRSGLTSSHPCKMWLCIALVEWLQRAYFLLQSTDKQQEFVQLFSTLPVYIFLSHSKDSPDNLCMGGAVVGKWWVASSHLRISSTNVVVH